MVYVIINDVINTCASGEMDIKWVFGLFTLTITNHESICIYKHFSMHKNFKSAFGTQKAPSFKVLNATLSPSGVLRYISPLWDFISQWWNGYHMSLRNSLFGFESWLGDHILDWKFSMNSSFLLNIYTNIVIVCYNHL